MSFSVNSDGAVALHKILTSAAPGFCDRGQVGGFQSGLVLAVLEAGFLVK